MQLSNFLRTVLKLDAASCLAMAALVLPMASLLERPLGVDAGELVAAALLLIPTGVFILWLGTRREAPAGLVGLVIAGNLAWAAASFAAAALTPAITVLGQFFIAGQGLVVFVLALAEWAGLKGSRQASWETA